MRTRFWKAILSIMVLLVVHGCSSSDGGGGGGGITPTEVTGVVVQGPVDGATVFADSLVTGTKFVLDEGEVYTETDANGEYTLPEVPYDSYQIVAVGGTDTLTQQPGVLMCAPEGITTITPMTTLVAMDPSLKTKIESNMHLAFDTNHAKTAVGCSTIALAKATEIAVAAVVQSIEKAFVDGAIALTPEQLQQVKAQIMSIVLTAIAEEFRLALDPAYVTDIEDVIWNALEKALTAINAAYPGVIVTDPAGMASAIVSLIDVCLGQTNDGDAADGELNDDINEVDFISINGLQTLIKTELENAVITISLTIQVTAPSPEATLLLPVVNSCTPADESVDIDVEEEIVINFNKPINPETLTPGTITVKDAAGNLIPITITYDETEGFVVKISPIEAWPYQTVLTVTITPAVKDVVATPLPLPVTSNLTTVPATQPPPPPPPAGDPVAGQAVYDSFCAGCHRLGTYDTTGFAPDLAGTTVTSLPSGHPAVPTTSADLVNLQAFVNTI